MSDIVCPIHCLCGSTEQIILIKVLGIKTFNLKFEISTSVQSKWKSTPIHFTVDSDAHFTVDSDAHFTVDSDAHFTVDSDAHFTVDSDAHFTVDSNS